MKSEAFAEVILTKVASVYFNTYNIGVDATDITDVQSLMLEEWLDTQFGGICSNCYYKDESDVSLPYCIRLDRIITLDNEESCSCYLSEAEHIESFWEEEE